MSIHYSVYGLLNLTLWYRLDKSTGMTNYLNYLFYIFVVSVFHEKSIKLYNNIGCTNVLLI